MNLPKDFESRIEQFECMRCNECCRKPGYVYLAEGEPEKISEFLSLDVRDFLDRFCDLLDRRRVVLKKQPGSEACVFLNDQGCVIHTAKPVQCLDFPRKWQTPASFDYCQGLKALFPEKL